MNTNDAIESVLQKGPKTRKEIVDTAFSKYRIKEKTTYAAIKRLTGTNILVEGNKLVWQDDQEVVDSKKLKLILGYLTKPKSQEQCLKSSKDLLRMCDTKKVVDPLIVQDILNEVKKQKNQDVMRVLFTCLGSILRLSKVGNNTKILRAMNNNRELFLKNAKNIKVDWELRVHSLNLLGSLKRDKKMLSAIFELVENEKDIDYPKIQDGVKSVLCRYAQVFELDVRRRLYDLLGSPSKELRNRAKYLFDYIPD